METLGSLVDKLTIKQIREFHLRQMLDGNDGKFTRSELEEKLKVLSDQKKELAEEIDRFAVLAARGKVGLKEEKLKLYNERKDIGRIPETESLGQAVSGLASKNLELWHLEDEARRKDVKLEYIGKIKGQIDLTNQQRNDFIDKIDELFEKVIRKIRSPKI